MRVDSPIAIGGVGGSGTRVVAELVRRLGVFTGDNLNKFNDNLDFPGLDRFLRITPDPVRPLLLPGEVAEFARIMRAGLDRHAEYGAGWGWKNPPNYLFLEQFAAHLPNLRYIHVIRDGLDMALSRNTRQVRQWGHLFDVTYGEPTKTASMLQFWIEANRFAVETASSLLGDRFMMINFDQMCRNPTPTILELARHLGVAQDGLDVDELSQTVSTPASLGRSNRWPNRRRFTAADAEEVAQFGFDDPRPWQ